VTSPLSERCAAAILAGGRARRFGGRDKASLAFPAGPIIDQQVALLQRIAEEILIVANEPDRYARLGLPVVADLVPGGGPLGGIYTAVVSASAERTLVVACDMPFLTLPFLKHLKDAGVEADVTIPRSREGYQPLCAVYARACAPHLRRRLDTGALRITDFLADVIVRELGPAEIEPFDAHHRLFVNVNSPEEYDRALALARQAP
jgi:molybdopterin-guanine dinucleotide biosynthesis protein A